MEGFEWKDMGLQSLFKALQESNLSVKIGILAEKDARTLQSPLDEGKNMSNATIGMIHEFGMGVPQRSFLRKPIQEQFQKYLQGSGAFDEKSARDVVKGKSLLPWVKKFGVIGVRIVNDAFDSGYDWQPSNMKYKTVHQTLVESQQLRNSITFQVEGGNQ